MSTLASLTRAELDEAIRMEVIGMRRCDGCQTTTRHEGRLGGITVEGATGPHLHWPDPITGMESVVAPTCTFLDADGVLNVLATMRLRGFVSKLRGMPPQVPYYRDDGQGGLKRLDPAPPRWTASFNTPLSDDPPWVDVTEFDENPALAVGRGALRAIREQAEKRRRA